MQGKRILVVGYGKLGQRVAARLAEQHQVFALKRSQCELPENLDILFADVTNTDSLKRVFNASLQDGVDYLIYCLSPSERSEQGYQAAYLTGLKNVLGCLPNRPRLQQLLFISSTSVYHQANGEQVNEESECSPKSFSGKILLAAEAYLKALDLATSSIRFSGIYGGGRSRLINQVKAALVSGTALPISPGLTNRIHEDDCVGFICHLIERLTQQQTLESCYLATDSCPVELAEVYRYLASELKAASSKYQRNELVLETSDAHRSQRRAGSKHCMNTRMRESGYVLKFESYKEGYQIAALEA